MWDKDEDQKFVNIQSNPIYITKAKWVKYWLSRDGGENYKSE